jgi:precorrin-6B methylase 2
MDENRPISATDAADPARIMQIGMGFFASRALLSAVELGVFDALEAGPLDGAALRSAVGLHERSAADFLDALLALGLLARAGDGAGARYANTEETASFLCRSSPRYLGGILVMASRRLYQHWGGLTEALRTGAPQNELRGQDGDTFAALYADPQRLTDFVDAMAGVQRENFRLLAERFDFRRYRTACDVGGASGALSMAIAGRHPHLACISYDLPAVCAIARERVAATGLADRIEVRPGDFMTEDLPRADVILMGNILHDWGTATKTMLIAKARAALPAGGVFIAIETVIDDARRVNAQGLLMSLNMLIETPEGYDYTFAQFDAWCRDAGFAATERLPLAGPASAVIARVPA